MRDEANDVRRDTKGYLRRRRGRCKCAVVEWLEQVPAWWSRLLQETCRLNKVALI